MSLTRPSGLVQPALAAVTPLWIEMLQVAHLCKQTDAPERPLIVALNR